MNSKMEYADAIGLIVGGTESQPIHNDVVKTKVNEDLYEKVMKMDYPPASVLLGFGRPVRIGVLKQDVQDLISHEGWKQDCSVKGANPNDRFRVVSDETVFHQKANKTIQTTNIVTLQGDDGFLFNGDFLHAGAPVVLTPGETEFETWSNVKQILQPLIALSDKLNAETMKTTFPRLCSVASLNMITRLHVQLCPILEEGEEFIVVPNSVDVYMDESQHDILASGDIVATKR
jgi:hypothetical protein